MNLPEKNTLKHDVISLTQSLVKIESENNHENDVSDYIRKVLEPYPFQLIYHEFAPNRANMFALWEPNPEADLIFFSGHLDTVPGYSANFSAKAEIREGKMYGRGTCDMKGGIAAFIDTVLSWLDSHPEPSSKGILLGFTVDEEMGCGGVDSLKHSPRLQTLFKRVKYCILAEPSGLKAVIAHKGVNRYRITFRGKAVHSSRPEEGDNAIYHAAQFITEVQQLAEQFNTTKQSPLGPSKVSVNVIHGGIAGNVIPDLCDVVVDRRYVTRENPEEDIALFTQLAQKCDPQATLVADGAGWPYMLPGGENNVIIKRWSQLWAPFEVAHFPAYTEADLIFRDFGIPVVILGPGSIDQAHQTPEYIEISQLELAVDYYARILTDFFQPETE